jgi:hypothetical protein
MNSIHDSLVKAAILAAIALGGGCAGCTRMDPVPEAVRGAWRGDAKIIVSWCKEARLPVSLSIAEDGHVEGKIGNATLREGYLARNRHELGRRLRINTDYIVRGHLEGTVVAAEPFRSVVVFIPFNLEERAGEAAVMDGGVTTSRSEAAPKKDWVVVCSDLELRRHGSAPETGR